MKVKILFFGQADEVVGKSELLLSFKGKTSLREVKNSLFQKYANLNTINLKWAVNQELIEGDLELNNGDEVAVLPPFAGG